MTKQWGLLGRRWLITASKIFIKKRHSDNTASNVARLRFMAISAYLGVSFISLRLVTVNIPNHDSLAVIVDIVILAMIIVIGAIARYAGLYRLVFHAIVAVLCISIPVGYFSEAGQLFIVLAPVTLLFAYFLLGKVGGTFWSIILLSIQLIVYCVDKAGYAKLSLEPMLLFQSAQALGFIGVMLYIFESNSQLNQELISRQSALLSQTNQRLAEELKDRKGITRTLQETVAATEKNNKFLQDSKLALINVLEDSNDLQEQLTQQKQNVEKKIELRTRQLAEEQARLQASIDTLDLGFLMTLADGSSILYNPAFLDICGFTETTPQHRTNMLNLFGGQIKSSCNLKKLVKTCLESGEAFSVNDLMINGRYIRILGSAIRVQKENSSLGVVLLVEDMSESKMLERSKDEFVSIASHELRTPLTAIRGNLSLLRLFHADKFTDKEVSSMMDDMSDSVIRLISIVNQFLTTSRLEQKKTVFEFSSVETAATINGVVSDLQSMADDKKLQMTVVVPADINNVTADKSRLQGVLTNLIGNAIKYTDQGTVEVSAENTGQTVTFRVKDSGKGIDTENQHLLFQKFQQATDNILTRDDSRSTGLGLYITKLMTEQMYGSVQLESSEIGKGSTFSLSLPAVKPV